MRKIKNFNKCVTRRKEFPDKELHIFLLWSC